MEEYFCPNCNAILNDQYGFDPSCGTWICTECGERLMDDDIYYGDTFEGIAWYCDDCGALLNRQIGFSDSYESWVCTECGFRNGTTEDDIIDPNKYTCPACGDVLYNQTGFVVNAEDWECGACGAMLHRSYSDDEFEEIEDEEKLKCPECDAVLEEQLFYGDYLDDWKCTECGAKLHRDYCSEPYSVVYEEDDENVEDEEKLRCPECDAVLEEQLFYGDYLDDWECTECGAKLHHDYYSEPYSVVYEDDDDNYLDENVEDETSWDDDDEEDDWDDDEEEEDIKCNNEHDKGRRIRRLPESELRKIRIRAFLLKFKKIQIKYSNRDLLGKNVNAVEILLYNQAFNYIKKVPVKDIYVDSPYDVGHVEKVIIDGKSEFDANDYVTYDADIEIRYHDKKEIVLPFGERRLRGMDHVDVRELLENLGFTDISERCIRDLVKGWIKKDGTVEKVTIGGFYPFRKKSSFTYDTKIVIEYHTFRKLKK